MSGPKRNPDKLNTLGVVVIGICSAVLVYVSIVALQAFYMKDTSEIQTMADYGGNDTNFRTVKTAAMNNITEYGKNPDGSFRVAIDVAMKKVVENKSDPAGLVPGTRSETPSAEPIFGRSKPLPAPAAGSGSDAGSGSAAGSAAGGGAGSGSAGSAAPPAAPMVPTGGQGQGGGPAPTTGAANPGTNNAGSGSAAPKANTGSGSAAAPKANTGSAATPKANAGSGSAAKGNAP